MHGEDVITTPKTDSSIRTIDLPKFLVDEVQDYWSKLYKHIVGESGSGKTTLAKLFLHFYEPEKGELLIDGEKISNYDLDSLRNSIAYVGQDTFLFSDTIRNNLIFGNTKRDK